MIIKIVIVDLDVNRIITTSYSHLEETTLESWHATLFKPHHSPWNAPCCLSFINGVSGVKARSNNSLSLETLVNPEELTSSLYPTLMPPCLGESKRTTLTDVTLTLERNEINLVCMNKMVRKIG